MQSKKLRSVAKEGKLCWQAECMPYTCLCLFHVLLTCLQTQGSHPWATRPPSVM